MTTKEKGDIALGKAISYFITEGYEVCLPIGDKRPWDMIVEKKGLLITVQVKYAGIYKKNNRCRVGLRITGGNQSFSVTKKYSTRDFDSLFVYSEKGKCYHIPWNEVRVRNELTIDDLKYQKYLV